MASPGTCVIIYNDDSQDRRRAEDLQLVCQYFKTLNYSIHLLEDMSAKAIRTELNKLTKIAAQNGTPSFVCCVLARGYESAFHAKSSSIMSFLTLQHDITCIELSGKPKILILDLDYKEFKLPAPEGLVKMAANSHFACITSILPLNPDTGRSIFLEQFFREPKCPLREQLERTRQSINRLGIPCQSLPEYKFSGDFDDEYQL